jgi:hypothetical protein
LILPEGAFADAVFSAILGEGQTASGEGGNELVVEFGGSTETQAGAFLMGN